MIETIRDSIEKYHLLRPEDAVIAAVSGGADSLCMLEILHRLGYRVTAVHVQHHLRESAEADARFTEAFCKERGIPFVRKDVDVAARRAQFGESPEEAARVLRYEALEEERKKAEEAGLHAVIALAHHQNDQAETVLFHLIRGSGLSGASGMRPKRGVFIRPMFFVTRREIEAWMEKEGISYCTDESNDSMQYTRNRIRKNVIPELEAIRPDAVRQIRCASEQFAEADAYLRELAGKWMKEHGVKCGPDGVNLPEELKNEAPVLMRYVIREAIRGLGASMKDLGSTHIEQVISLFSHRVGKEAFLPGGLFAKRQYQGVSLTVGEEPACGIRPALRLEFRVFEHTGTEKIPEKEYTKWFDYDRIRGDISLRPRRAGDRFSTREGTHKKVKDWMIDEKIPVNERDRLMVVADEEEVLWVPGYRRGESKKVTTETRRILEITAVQEASYERQDQRSDSGREGK